MTVGSSLRVFALVSDAFGGYGGIAQYNRDFLTSLAASDWIGEVIILPRTSTTWPGILPSGVRQLRSVKGRLAYSLAALRIARAQRPIDLVFCGHVFMAPLAAILAKLLRAQLWVQVHGTEAWQELSSLHRWSIERAVLITSVSRYTRRRLLEWVGIDPARVKVLPNTVDSRFQPGSKPDYLAERHATSGTKVLLTVSRLATSERYKGHDRVIRALPRLLRRHPDTIYLIVGDGDDRPRLEALAIEFGVMKEVQFVGPVAPKDLADYFRLADVFVMPSTGEGFGISFLEAIASGLHVIGGNRDGSVDALGDGSLGILVDPDNCEELVSAIHAALMSQPCLCDRAKRFKRHLFMEYLDSLYQFVSTQKERKSGGAKFAN
jgi:phosphatidylinositol alpha-1,6-mannosyltransferase